MQRENKLELYECSKREGNIAYLACARHLHIGAWEIDGLMPLPLCKLVLWENLVWLLFRV